MVEWPSSLPQSPLLDGFSDEPQNSVLRSDMDGLTKQRNRFTAVLHNVNETYYMTRQQYQTFVSFYESDLGNGSAEFIKPSAQDGVNRVFRFAAVYSASPVGLDYIVRIQLEKLP